MAITVDATTYASPDYGDTAIVVSHTVAADANFLLVGIARGNLDNALTISPGPAWNGTSMGSAIGDAYSTGPSRMQVWALTAPATGTHNLTFTMSATNNGRIGVMVRSYKGVDQATPYGTVATNVDGGGATPYTVSMNVSSATGELVSDFIYGWGSTGLTVGAGQTERVNQPTTSGSYYGSSDEDGATTTTMSWSVTANWQESAQVGVPLKAASGTTLYFLDSAAPGSNFGQLQVGGSAPSTATTATGWTVDTVGATNYALMAYASERLSTTFSGTAQPAGNPDNSLGDCFRSTSTLTGDFATGAWTIAVPVIAVSAAAGQDGRVRVRLWKSSNATGTSPTEITAGAVAGTTVTNLTTGAEQVSTVTTASITGFSMTNEYLFVQIAWEITGAAT